MRTRGKKPCSSIIGNASRGEVQTFELRPPFKPTRIILKIGRGENQLIHYSPDLQPTSPNVEVFWYVHKFGLVRERCEQHCKSEVFNTRDCSPDFDTLVSN